MGNRYSGVNCFFPEKDTIKEKMKKIFFLIIIILVLATLFTVLFGWVDLKLTLRKQYIEDTKLKEGGFIGFTEISAPGGFPFSFLCYGLCPWRFNTVHFIINVFFTTVLIMFIILTVRFLFKKKKIKNTESMPLQT